MKLWIYLPLLEPFACYFRRPMGPYSRFLILLRGNCGSSCECRSFACIPSDGRYPAPYVLSSCCALSFPLTYTLLQIRALSNSTHLSPFMCYTNPLPDSQLLLLLSVLSHGELRNCLCSVGTVLRLAKIFEF